MNFGIQSQYECVFQLNDSWNIDNMINGKRDHGKYQSFQTPAFSAKAASAAILSAPYQTDLSDSTL